MPMRKMVTFLIAITIAGMAPLFGFSPANAADKSRDEQRLQDSGADTDVTMRAEILTYSRSRGLFAGVSLEGSTLRPDNGGNENVYGKKVDARDIVLKGAVSVPEAAHLLVDTLERHSPKNHSNPKSLE